MPKETEWAYVAGMVDGDGCIAIAKDRRGNPIHWYYRVSVRITQVEYGMSLLLWLRETFAGHICVGNKVGGKYTRATYNWFVRGRDVKGFLVGILPYLRLKKSQAQLALDFLEFKAKNRATSSRREKNLAIFEAQNILHDAMHDLNQHRTMV